MNGVNEPIDEALDRPVQFVTTERRVAAVDEWRRQQPDLPSRSEAIRRLLEKALQADRGDCGQAVGDE